MGRKTYWREKEVCLKVEIAREKERERQREREIYIYRFSQNSDIFLDIFGPSIGPHTMQPLQPHGDEKKPTTISCTWKG